MVDTVYWLPIGGPAVPADWLGPKVGGHLAPFLYSSREPSELSQWLCCDDSTINIVVVIIIIIIMYVLLWSLGTRYIKMFILDEADEMLSRGFKDQIYDVFRTLNENIQVYDASDTGVPRRVCLDCV